MTGICSSAPPWIINSGAGIGVVNRPGSFAFSSSFHVGIVALMWISFAYPLSLIAFAPFFRCERLVEWFLDRGRIRTLTA